MNRLILSVSVILVGLAISFGTNLYMLYQTWELEAALAISVSQTREAVGIAQTMSGYYYELLDKCTVQEPRGKEAVNAH